MAQAVQGPVHLDAGLVLLRRDPPVLCSEIELVGAAIAVDMRNRERFITVNSELPHERRDDLVVAMLHERWIVFLIWGDENRMTGSWLSSRNICNTFGLQ